MPTKAKVVLGQVVDSDLLLCTGFDLVHAVLFLYQSHIFTERPMNDRKIEAAMGAALAGNSQFHRNFISHIK